MGIKFVPVVLTVLLIVRISDQIPVRPNRQNFNAIAEDQIFTVTIDPLENRGVEILDGELIEGDIRQWHGMVPETAGPEEINAPGMATLASMRQNSHQTRHSVSNEESWVDRIIPYTIDPTFSVSDLSIINSAIQNLTSSVQNCIEFVPRQNQEDYIYITGQGSGCYSEVGKKGGNQTLSISRISGCVTKGIIMHELMHALGFWHEHNRPDRDNYIEIVDSNIRIDHLDDFRINPNGKILVNAYDYYSIMHYKTTQFSKDYLSLKTINILQPGIDEAKVGQREGLSKYDIERIMILYGCQKGQRSVENEPTPAAVREPTMTSAISTRRQSPTTEVRSRQPLETTYRTRQADISFGRNDLFTEGLQNPQSETEVGRK
ncbi:hypothetical protein ACF0H5_000696 [Mactra antiquata]